MPRLRRVPRSLEMLHVNADGFARSFQNRLRDATNEVDDAILVHVDGAVVNGVAQVHVACVRSIVVHSPDGFDALVQPGIRRNDSIAPKERPGLVTVRPEEISQTSCVSHHAAIGLSVPRNNGNGAPQRLGTPTGGMVSRTHAQQCIVHVLKTTSALSIRRTASRRAVRCARRLAVRPGAFLWSGLWARHMLDT